jgi:hypothetical protein
LKLVARLYITPCPFTLLHLGKRETERGGKEEERRERERERERERRLYGKAKTLNRKKITVKNNKIKGYTLSGFKTYHEKKS